MKLDVWLKRDHAPAERLAVVAGLCGALVEAHQRGVVRGGLAPSGVDVDGDGSCRLDLDPPGPGSPYAAPESAQGGPPTAKAEIFSAGLLCYETLSGQPSAVQSSIRKPLQDLRPDLPTDLTDAVMACLEADPDWRPADLSYLLAVVRGLQQSQPATPARTAPRRVAVPPRTFLESAPRQTGDDRGPVTRVLPVILVLVAILATGGAWLWFEVLSPRREASGPASSPGAAVPSAPVTVAEAPSGEEEDPQAEPGEVGPSAAAPLPPRTSGASVPPSSPASTGTPPEPRAASPSAPAALPTSTPTDPPATKATPSAPPTLADVEPVDAEPDQPNPEPAAPSTGEAGPASGPASIRAIAPFRVRPGAMNVLDVHGANLRSDHRAKVTVKRETVPGFGVTRYQLRSPALLLVFLQVDAGVRAGKYAFSLVGPDGAETNAFTIEVGR